MLFAVGLSRWTLLVSILACTQALPHPGANSDHALSRRQSSSATASDGHISDVDPVPSATCAANVNIPIQELAVGDTIFSDTPQPDPNDDRGLRKRQSSSMAAARRNALSLPSKGKSIRRYLAMRH